MTEDLRNTVEFFYPSFWMMQFLPWFWPNHLRIWIVMELLFIAGIVVLFVGVSRQYDYGDPVNCCKPPSMIQTPDLGSCADQFSLINTKYESLRISCSLPTKSLVMMAVGGSFAALCTIISATIAILRRRYIPFSGAFILLPEVNMTLRAVHLHRGWSSGYFNRLILLGGLCTLAWFIFVMGSWLMFGFYYCQKSVWYSYGQKCTHNMTAGEFFDTIGSMGLFIGILLMMGIPAMYENFRDYNEYHEVREHEEKERLRQEHLLLEVQPQPTTKKEGMAIDIHHDHCFFFD